MTNTTIELLIKLLAEKLDISEGIDRTSNLNDVGLDSLDIINFLYLVEEKTQVKIPDEDLIEFGLETIQDFADYIDAKQN